MGSLTQEPLLSPQPNPEPPSFPILRDIMSRKIINEQGNPYGFDPSAGKSMESMWSGNGRGTFDPYSGNYGSNPGSYSSPGSMAGGASGGGMYGFGGGGQGMPMGGNSYDPGRFPGQGGVAGPGQGGMQGGQQGGDFIQMLMKMLQGGQGGGQQQMQAPMMTGSMGNDGCQMGNDSVRPPMRPPMAPHAPDPRHAMAMKMIMRAMMAKRAQQRPQMGGMQPRPMGMDAPPFQPWNQTGMSWMQQNPGGHGAMGLTPSSSPTNIQSLEGSFSPNSPTAGYGAPMANTNYNPMTPRHTNPSAPQVDPNNFRDPGVAQGWLNMNPGNHGAMGSTPHYTDPNNPFGGAGGNVAAPAAAAATPIGHDSPYMFQHGPMSPLGMDAVPNPGPGLPGPFASNFGAGGSQGGDATAALMQILGGGGGGGMGGGMGMQRRRPQPMFMGNDGVPKHQSARFVVAGKGGRPHRLFDEPRVL